jgi:acetolactate synthase I/II/III large subunit
VAGNGVNLSRARAELAAVAERLGAPVATTVSGKGAFPEDHPLSVGVIGWVGTAAANRAGREADLVLTVGARMSEATTSSWQPGASFDFRTARLIQCDVEPDEISNVYAADVALIGDARRTLIDLGELRGAPDPSWLRSIWAERATWRDVVRDLAESTSDPRPVGPVVAALRRYLHAQPVTIVCDFGKHAKWIAQQFEVHVGDTVLSSMGAGTMGIGPSGAIGAALGAPENRTVAWVGDGGMAMSLPVLATAAEYQVPVLFIVINDQAFGEIVNLQQQRFGRTVFAEFNGNGRNPGYQLDIAGVAEASGVPARRVATGDDLNTAMEWGLAQRGPALLDISVDRRSRVPLAGGFKLTDIWNHPIQPWVRAAAPFSGKDPNGDR